MDKRYIQKVEKIFETLTLPLRLYDELGQGIVPAGGRLELPGNALAHGINHRVGDLLVRAPDMHPTLYVTAPVSAPGAEDVLRMADVMLVSIFRSGFTMASHTDVYRRVLRQELPASELTARANEHQIAQELNRCVMLFQVDRADQISAYQMLAEYIPLGETDALVEMNRHTVALIKDMDGMDGPEELYQFAQAVQTTLLEEAVHAHNLTVGVGDEKPTLARLGESYAEARRAMEVGQAFHPEQSIHMFRRLMLERFLMNVGREEGMRYHSLLFNAQTMKLFNDEMLQTIEMFFRKDLNLSDTARQLFIHRNTLVYRLDKVLRVTGLDLRRFDDAVTFKILYELQKCGREKPKQID